ncbi:hypothetical protein P1X14_05325 [Sphingomonas sp. AOB5]|uniref:hypothetical protein n=1 Tax=Sphingomonas sp. AOB5 TaxID=3034017 RepID=UPI0023F9D235|nr:hypothetical protein [Sphingomonas sp. AOB5]MDF7774660.1 hypothetical protein [Sphingomonas sp. AOB5]
MSDIDRNGVGRPEWLLAVVASIFGFGAGIAADRFITGASGDPLAFAGALCGAAAAVIGAEIVGTRHRRKERTDARSYQVQLLKRMSGSIATITADYSPHRPDPAEFKHRVRDIARAIGELKLDATLVSSPDVQRSAGWNVDINHVTRLVSEAGAAYKLFDTAEIEGGDQIALAHAMAVAIAILQPARLKIEDCLRYLEGPAWRRAKG